MRIYTLITLFILLFSSEGWAQSRFGYLSYNKVLEMMPEYKKTIGQLNQLKEQYNKEAKHSEEELERKFAEFIQGKNDFPENILQKRQNELQQLTKNNIQFREEAEVLLQNAEKDLMAKMNQKLQQALDAVGKEMGLPFILNTDGNSCPFIHPSYGMDVTQQTLMKLGIVKKKRIGIHRPEGKDSITIQGKQADTRNSQEQGNQKLFEALDSTLIQNIQIPDSITDNLIK